MDRPRLSIGAYFKRLATVLAVVFAVFTVMFGAIGASKLLDAALLAREGVNAQALVTGHDQTTRRRNGVTSHDYYLLLQLNAQDGRSTALRAGVTRAEYNQSPDGALIPIRYAASDPETYELHEGDKLSGGRIVTPLAGISFIALLVSLFFMVRSTASQRRAARDGEQRMARVVHVEQVGKKARAWSTVQWDDGTTTGKTGQINTAKAPAVGSEIAVFIDPRTGRGWWVGEY